MSKLKTHLEIITRAANESDPDAESYILCGQDVAENLTFNENAVTCKRCLARIKEGTP